MTLAGRVREAAKQLREFKPKDLFDALEVRSYKERDSVRDSLRDFLRRREIQRVDRGLYRYIGREERITFRQRFWNIGRRMIQFCLDDLEQLTGANRETIREFCSWMVKEGYARRVKNGHFKVTGALSPIVPKAPKKSNREIL